MSLRRLRESLRISKSPTAGSAGVQAYSTALPPSSQFPISRPSGSVRATSMKTIWPPVHMNDGAEIRLNAYPGQGASEEKLAISGLDSRPPNPHREGFASNCQNPGIMRLGMFVKATFRGQTTEMHTDRCPPPRSSTFMTAIMFIHPLPATNSPARWKWSGGDSLPNNMQEVKSGHIKAGQQVVVSNCGGVLNHARSSNEPADGMLSRN